MSDPFQMIIEDLGQKFVNDMVTLFNEQPSLFEGRSTRDEWIHQVLKAKADLEGRVGVFTAVTIHTREFRVILEYMVYNKCIKEVSSG